MTLRIITVVILSINIGSFCEPWMAYSIVSCNLHKQLAQTGITDEREK